MHGYSSSEESEDPRRPRGPPPAAAAPADQKKKKKKKAPPQAAINRIWKKFSNRNFNKALAILPFDPVLPPATLDEPNELITAGYERAAEECRRKVKKIIQECRRVNMRYRDKWDIDWDLKYERGHCLNTLGSSKFDLSQTSLRSPTATVPKAVKRVHEIFENPTFLKNISGNDVKQGNLGDCWLMASLTSLAHVNQGLQRICVEYDTRIGIYGFVFYRDGEWIYSIIDDKLYLKSPCWDSPSMQRDLLNQIDREDVERVYRKTYQTGSKALFFAQCKDQDETWLPLVEKAYAKAHGDYSSLSGGWIGEGLEDLTGGVTTELLSSDILDIDSFWDNELSRVNDEFLFGCSTGLLDGGYGDREGISEGHAYVVMDARTLKSGERLVKLRNPWGKIRKGMWEGAWSDGSKEWTTEVQKELGHSFGNDSVFWISYEDMLRKYQHFDRTRLFRDPGWHCSQRWIGVEVPWKPQYNEKFQFKLKRDSPIAFVLSQLDGRYFKGLRGQYTYKLHFRLHEKGRPSAEDYIVRSHGNYLMDRSVSVDLPDMPAGEYSVFISVTAERDPDLNSVEDVVKRECKQRSENEKLTQVGQAYDLAHSKATAHLEHIAKLRKQRDQAKASDYRSTERRKQWERRRQTRDVLRRQTTKNEQKKAQKAAEKAAKLAAQEKAAREAKEQAEAEAKAKAEQAESGKPKDQAVQTDNKAEKKAGASGDQAEEQKESNSDNPKLSNPSGAKRDEDSAKATDKKSADDDENKNVSSEKPTKTPHEGYSNSKATDEAEDASKLSEGKATTTDTPDDNAEDKLGSASDSIGSPKDTPVSENSTIVPTDPKEEEAVRPIDKSPPEAVDAVTATKTPEEVTTAKSAEVAAKTAAEVAAAAAAAAAATAAAATAVAAATTAATVKAKAIAEAGDSSDSPIEDWEALYSSDDMSRKPRPLTTPAPVTQPASSRYESEEENTIDPWNAICVVGFRVYSRDPDLTLRVVIEGEELQEGGMGEKGEADLDNAQANAGGAREEKKPAEGEEGFPPFPKVVQKGGEEFPDDKKDGDDADDEDDDDEEMDVKDVKSDEAQKLAVVKESEDGKDDKASEKGSDKGSESTDFSHLDGDSGSSTPDVLTPEPTPCDPTKDLTFT